MEQKLIAIYARVSTSHQENEGTIETQIVAIKDYAQKNNLIIIQEYLDNGWSGDILARPALDQLRQDAKNKIWNGVLIYDSDRLARRYSYQELVMDELKEAGIEIIFVATTAPKNPEDKILHGVRGLFAEYERAKITERFRLGKIRKVKEGHILTSRSPYGYNYIRGDKTNRIHGKYEINEDEAMVVRMMFSWIADQGFTMREVIQKLHKLGIKPRYSKKETWSTSTLTTLLRNKTYCGEAHWGTTKAIIPDKPIKLDKYRKMKKSSRIYRPEEEWYKIPGVPAIISEDLYTRTRAQLDKNYKELPSRNKKHEYLLAGKIRCVCGRARTGEAIKRSEQIHLYYRCCDRVLKFPQAPECKEKGFNAKIADKLVWNRIAELMGSPEMMKKQIAQWLNSRQNKTKSITGDVKIIEKEISKIKKEEDRYNKAYGAGFFNLEQLKEYTAPLREKVASLELQISKVRQQESEANDSTVPTDQEIQEFAKEATEKFKNLNFQLKRAIIGKVINKVIGTQQYLKVNGQVPIAMMEHGSIYRYCRASECGQKHSFQGPD